MHCCASEEVRGAKHGLFCAIYGRRYTMIQGHTSVDRYLVSDCEFIATFAHRNVEDKLGIAECGILLQPYGENAGLQRRDPYRTLEDKRGGDTLVRVKRVHRMLAVRPTACASVLATCTDTTSHVVLDATLRSPRPRTFPKAYPSTKSGVTSSCDSRANKSSDSNSTLKSISMIGSSRPLACGSPNRRICSHARKPQFGVNESDKPRSLR